MFYFQFERRIKSHRGSRTLISSSGDAPTRGEDDDEDEDDEDDEGGDVSKYQLDSDEVRRHNYVER